MIESQRSQQKHKNADYQSDEMSAFERWFEIDIEKFLYIRVIGRGVPFTALITECWYDF
jgi:hypothetical protein